MVRSLVIFLGTLIVGALVALVARAALFSPHEGQEANAVGGGDYPAMVTNQLVPAKAPANKEAAEPAKPPAAATAHEHGHAAAPAAANTAADQPVNTVCAMCGMDVDPKLPTSTYQGKTIGFGCKMCRPKFEKDPGRWGPIYLKNEVVNR